MSIEDEINRLCADGTLYNVPQSWPGLPAVRVVYVSSEVRQMLFGPWQDKQHRDRGNDVRAWVDKFIDGKRIYVRPDGVEGTDAELARLDPPNDEVWTLRDLKPRPSIRVFGTFALRNILVALNWAWRLAGCGKTPGFPVGSV
jgi:hypothetical protein